LSMIERFEKGGCRDGQEMKPQEAAAQLNKMLSVHPYQCLMDVALRPEFKLLCRCSAFLIARDPEYLIRVLLARVMVKPVEQTNVRDIDYFGNAAASIWPALSEESRKKIIEWHQSGVSDPIDDRALLHSSVLVQLGGMNDAVVAKGSHAVKEMWRLINE